jgi:membrane-bound lytic murein transglycosylase D
MTVRLARFVVISLAFLLMPAFLLGNSSFASENDFPLYPAIADNVRFWEKVYSEYTLSQGVVHDRNDLGIVYAVITLQYPGRRGARRANQRRIDQVKDRYRRILLKLARGGKPSSFEERRVLHLFGPSPAPESMVAAADNIRLQMGQRGRFKRGLIRAGAYLAEIREIFREYGLPEDLAYLAHVESSFNHKAYSKAGAVGLWQFIRGTGQRYLNIGSAVDERRDPLKSSRAAAEFLRDNYQKFGSWPLAITAYNHGQGGVKRAIQAKGDFPRIIREYQGTSFGFASRNFYAEFLAAKQVAANYQKYFGELVVSRPGAYHYIALEGYADARRLAAYLNITIDTIKEFNPDLSGGVLQGKRFIPAGYELRLPAAFGEQARLAAVIPASVYRDAQKNRLFHAVLDGETVYDIASRYDVEVAELLFANQLYEGAVIFAGQNLRIPKSFSPRIYLTKAYKIPVRSVGGASDEADV